MKAKIAFFIAFLLLFFFTSFGQDKKKLIKSWIRRESHSLPDNAKIADTSYTRYSFQKNKVYISFYPGWNKDVQEWHMADNHLTIGFATYDIEELTDSTLIIAQPGFQRVVWDDENYLNQKSGPPLVVGTFEGEPLYEATRVVTPRCKREDLRSFIAQNLEGYNIRKAITFTAHFVVKKDGTVDAIQIISGITYGFDTEVTKQLKKTSKEWTPAFYKGQAIQTQMTYTIKYFNSLLR